MLSNTVMDQVANSFDPQGTHRVLRITQEQLSRVMRENFDESELHEGYERYRDLVYDMLSQRNNERDLPAILAALADAAALNTDSPERVAESVSEILWQDGLMQVVSTGGFVVESVPPDIGPFPGLSGPVYVTSTGDLEPFGTAQQERWWFMEADPANGLPGRILVGWTVADLGLVEGVWVKTPASANASGQIADPPSSSSAGWVRKLPSFIWETAYDVGKQVLAGYLVYVTTGGAGR